MSEFSHVVLSRTADQTAALAQHIGAGLRPGDVLLLEGPVGAGKSHFARALILSLLEVPEDVPSPTFTLVQTYDTARGEVWQSDLYRLSSPDEVIELGLTEAFEDAICLVEWPDRLGDLLPEGALRIALSPEGDDIRRITLTGPARWQSLLEDADV